LATRHAQRARETRGSLCCRYADVTPQTILAASARALELDPDLAEAHALRGVARSTLNRHDEAEQEFKAGMRLAPNLFEVLKFYARACQSQGRFAEAAVHFEQACAASPDDIRCPVLLAQNYRDLGRRDEATLALRQSPKRSSANCNASGERQCRRAWRLRAGNPR
jgi:adenylate cyclase